MEEEDPFFDTAGTQLARAVDAIVAMPALATIVSGAKLLRAATMCNSRSVARVVVLALDGFFAACAPTCLVLVVITFPPHETLDGRAVDGVRMSKQSDGRVVEGGDAWPPVSDHPERSWRHVAPMKT